MGIMDYVRWLSLHIAVTIPTKCIDRVASSWLHAPCAEKIQWHLEIKRTRLNSIHHNHTSWSNCTISDGLTERVRIFSSLALSSPPSSVSMSNWRMLSWLPVNCWTTQSIGVYFHNSLCNKYNPAHFRKAQRIIYTYRMMS